MNTQEILTPFCPPARAEEEIGEEALALESAFSDGWLDIEKRKLRPEEEVADYYFPLVEDNFDGLTVRSGELGDYAQFQGELPGRSDARFAANLMWGDV